MSSVQKAIFPGIALGSIFLVFITSLIANPVVSQASSLPVLPTQVNQQPTLAAEGAGETAAAEIPPATDQPAVEQAQSEEPEKKEEQPPAEVVEESAPPECSVNGAYPDAIRQWCSLIEKYAGENGIEPNLVAAVMLQESGGKPDAYSKSGAVGLMQVMPRDGLAASFMCPNGPCFGARPSMEELYDPEFNVRFGVGMLAGLIRKHGDVREGLRAYGPMNYGYRYADLILNIMARYQ